MNPQSPSDAASIMIARQARLRPSRPVVHLCVPVFNEEEMIGPFLAEVLPVVDGINADWKILFVNDGSRDRTLTHIIDRMRSDDRISVINLARQFGKEAAMTCAIDAAEGDAVVIMDVDLQDPPAVLADFVEAWRAGYDVAYGARISRRGDDMLKRQSAAMFYKIFNAISPLKIPHDAGDFRIMDRRAVLALRQLRERNRFMKGIFSWVGFSVVAVHYPRPQRVHGASKFRLGRLWNFALDGLFGFSTIPLKAWTYCGLAIAVGAIAYALMLVFRTLVYGITVPGYASLMVVMLVGVATQLISAGMLGEYLARLTAEAKGRPLYIVEHHYGQADIGGVEVAPRLV